MPQRNSFSPQTNQNTAFSPLKGETSGIPGQRGDATHQMHGIYGNLLFVDAKNTDKVVRTWQSKPFHPKNVRHGWMPPHPTLFLRKEVYKKHGQFNTSFKIAGDYDFMLRVMTDPKINLRYLPEVITRMRVGGARPVKFVRKHFTGQAPAV